MTKKFNLTENIIEINYNNCRYISGFLIPTKDVAEFIRLEDRLLVQLRNGEITWGQFWILRDNLSGKSFSNHNPQNKKQDDSSTTESVDTNRGKTGSEDKPEDKMSPVDAKVSADESAHSSGFQNNPQFSNHSPKEHETDRGFNGGSNPSVDSGNHDVSRADCVGSAPEDTQNNPQQKGCGEEVLIQPNKDGAYYPFECGKRYKQGLFICDECKKKTEVGA